MPLQTYCAAISYHLARSCWNATFELPLAHPENLQPVAQWQEAGFQVFPMPGKAAGSSMSAQHPLVPQGPTPLQCFGPEAEKK